MSGLPALSRAARAREYRDMGEDARRMGNEQMALMFEMLADQEEQLPEYPLDVLARRAAARGI